MPSINIGIKVDLHSLLLRRMMLQASSGGGKSYMLRVITEQLLSHVPVILIDPEGEFITLREKHDIVIVGPGGEMECEVKSAALLARGLVEQRVSAVIDVSELRVPQRQEYVKRFIDAIVDQLPKRLWPSRKGKAVVVIVDEAHMLCPQGGKAVSKEAVIDLASRGRKRGICAILATQRLSKLDKSASAELGTKLIGCCDIDDAPRACDALGLPKTEKHGLTQIETGDWRAIGPALAKGIQSFRGAKAKTSHAKAGPSSLTPPAPSARLKKIIPKLQELQKKTAQEMVDLEQAKKDNANLRRENTRLRKDGPKAEPKIVEKLIPDPESVRKALVERDREWSPKLTEANRRIMALDKKIRLITKALGADEVKLDGQVSGPDTPPAAMQKVRVLRPVKSTKPSNPPAPNGDLLVPQQRVLNSLAWWKMITEDPVHRALVAIMADYKVSGNFNNILGKLHGEGYIEYAPGSCVLLTEQGDSDAVHPDIPGGLDDLHEAWRSKLKDPQIKLLNVIIERHPNEITKDELAEETSYAISGNFNNLLGQLRALGVIPKRGPIKATNYLFPEGL